MVVHQPHDIGDVLAFGDGTRGVALKEVAAADGTHIGRIRTLDGFTQAGELRITLDTTMGIVLIKNHNTFLCRYRKTAHHQGYHGQVIFLCHHAAKIRIFSKTKNNETKKVDNPYVFL